MRDVGLLFLGLGGLFLLVGGALLAGHWLHLPLGKLPGDIRVERPGFQFYFPVVTCILLSLALTGIMYLINRFRG